MKQILTIALVAIALSSNAQSKDSSKVDINNMPLLTINDLSQFDNKILAELPAKYTDAIREYMKQLIQARLQQLQPKEQPKKK